MIENSQSRIEMITVRLNSGNEDRFMEILRHVEEGVRLGKCQAQSVRFLRSEQVTSDWAVQLHYPAVESREKSPLAIHLAEALRSVGLVNHTIWGSHHVDDRTAVPSNSFKS